MYHRDFNEELQENQPTHDLKFAPSRKLAGRFVMNENKNNSLELPEPSRNLHDESDDEVENSYRLTATIRSWNMNSEANNFLNGKKTLPIPHNNKDTVQNGSLTILFNENYFKLQLPPKPESEYCNEKIIKDTNNKEENQKNSSLTISEYSTASDDTNSSYCYPNSNISSMYCTAKLMDSTASEGSSKSFITIDSSNYFGSEESISFEDTSKDSSLLL